ncbi:MAG: xylan 1,4-beta-xylosidase [Oscillospiraceae bacterium]|nr:xylan 1,4-beta-xylosidase [Oscillospiraceae bacterium]
MADRFKRIYKQGVVSVIEIWVDTETGVNYLYREDGYSGGLTPLLDRDGKPVVTDTNESV